MRFISRNGFETRLPLVEPTEALRRQIGYRHRSSLPELRLVRIVWALPCERVEHCDDGGSDAYGIGLDRVVVDALPTEIAFALALGIAATADDFAEPHRFLAEVTSPTGAPAARFEGPLPVTSVTSVAEPDELVSTSDGLVQFVARDPGIFRISVSVDDVVYSQFAMHVAVADTDGA